MKKTYYLFNPGRLSRKDNTLKFVPTDESGKEGKPKYLPVEGVANLFVFGNLVTNSAILNFLGKHKISVHYFDYYEHYTGSFQPKEYLLAGKIQIEQTKAYLDQNKRMHIATALVEGAATNMLRNLKYYDKRGRDTLPIIEQIEQLVKHLPNAKKSDVLMGIEGNIRQHYYDAFELIILHFEMGNRVKRPPSNEINALISFGNMLCYTLALDQLYHTQLNPTISFLHEPGYRRYSLALDLAEVFKPILTDRVIFRLLNKKEIQANHFEKSMNGCLLKENGRKVFLKAWEEKINETFKHRSLGRKVSYKRLIKLEAYKISKYILGIEESYKPFKIWW